MGVSGIAVQPIGEGNFEASVQFLAEWVSDGEAEARRYLADHAEPEGGSLVATCGHDVVGYVAILWESNFAGFRARGIPLVHQVAVAGPFRRQGVATLLMEAAEQLARERGIATLGITVGLFDEYGPAQRLYGQRGYIRDGLPSGPPRAAATRRSGSSDSTPRSTRCSARLLTNGHVPTTTDAVPGQDVPLRGDRPLIGGARTAAWPEA